MSIYTELTRAFNEGGVRAILSSGQAVVLHRLALASKDGDWILREDPGDLGHVLAVLARHGACYRFGAPLDVRWLAGGWSAHLEFAMGGLRIRTDFVTRPPRLPETDLAGLWREVAHHDLPYLDARRLAEIKKTNREKDYPIIGELARRMPDPRDQLLLSRSARDLIDLSTRHATLAATLVATRPLLARVSEGRDVLEAALDAERRQLMHANEARLRAYLDAAGAWAKAWPDLDRELAALPLDRAHTVMVERATALLPGQVDLG